MGDIGTLGIFGFATFFPLFFTAIWCFAFIFGIASFVIWVWAIVDIATRPDDKFPKTMENAKIVWLLIVLFTQLIGAILYYFLVYRVAPKR